MIHLFVTSCGRPELIELQMQAFQKNLQEVFKFTVFNNSMWDKPQEYNGINEMCRKLHIQVIDIQKDPALIVECEQIEKIKIFNTQGNYTIVNLAAQYSDNWAWRNVISKETGAIGLFHADVFMVRPATLTDYLKNNDLVYVPQSRPGIGGDYMHDSLVLANIQNLPDVQTINWCGGLINGIPVDGGGQTYHYLKAHPDIKKFQIGYHYVQDDLDLDFHPSDFEWYPFDGYEAFLHYRTGMDWNHRGLQYHEAKTKWLMKQLDL